MLHEKYRQAYLDLRLDVITEINHKLIKENATEIELHNGIVHVWVNDQHNEVIKRINVESGSVQIDTGHDSYWIEYSELSLDELLAILQLLEAGSYEVWETFED